jgi:hypothetical protein
MRALKALVIVLGILLVGGTVALVATIISRAGRSPAGAPVVTATARAPYETALGLPAGSQILAVEPAGERVLIRAVPPDGRELLFILDLASGARLGTVELRPAR